MLKLGHPELVEGRSLPQRNEQFNSSIHRIYVSPRLIKQAGFNANVILLDAAVSGWVALRWTKRYASKFNRLIKRHIFGLFVISASVVQFLPVTQAETQPINNVVKEQRQVVTFTASVKEVVAPSFQRPVKGGLSQGFWYVHPAIDVPNPYGAKVKPIAEGRVTFAGWSGGYGYTVIIKHKAGFSSRYAHLSRIHAKSGSYINKKTVIGTVGTTGYATGSHLHLEVYDEGRATDPQKFLPKD